MIKMKNIKRTGIYMTHSEAHIIEIVNENINISTIESEFTHQDKLDSLTKSESLMHNKEQHEQAKYYKNLSKVILNCDQVLLFGPTDAKEELFNLISDDHHFNKVQVELKQTDKLTKNQQEVYVNDFFMTDL